MCITSLIAAYKAHNNMKSAKMPEADEKKPPEQEPESVIINELEELIRQHSEAQDSDRALIESVRQAWGFTDRDNVQIFVVDMAQFRRMPITNFVTRPTTSPRLQQMERNVAGSRSRIHELENGLGDPTLTDEERTRQIAGLEDRLTRYRRAVLRERARLATAPRSGVVVVARENS